MSHVNLGVMIDVLNQYQCDVQCALEIAMYRERNCSSPTLENAMIATFAERKALHKQSPELFIIGQHAPNDIFAFGGSKPRVHYNFTDARAEQQRLANSLKLPFAMFALVSTYTPKD